MAQNSIIKALEVALEADPNNVELLRHLASLYFNDGAFENALQTYQKLLLIDPVDVIALKGAADTALTLGDHQKNQAYVQLLENLVGNSKNKQMDGKLSPHSREKGSSDTYSEKPVFSAKTLAKLKLVSGSECDDSDDTLEDAPTLSLDDVGGMSDVKKRLNMAFLAPLRNPDLMRAYGKSVRGGLMLYGPPGCGKTFIARALAGEMGAHFISIGLTDILDMYQGQSEKKLHAIFELARGKAPSVVFIDELDAIGQKRSSYLNSSMRTLVNQLLSELDGIGQDNKDLFVLGATNHPWEIDSALTRPGRFDRVVAVFPPDAPARKAILEKRLAKLPAKNINVEKIVRVTHRFSGADLAHLCDSVIEYALEDSIESGVVRPVTQSDFNKARKEVKASTLPWFQTAKNYAMFANESGTYDDLLTYIQENKL